MTSVVALVLIYTSAVLFMDKPTSPVCLIPMLLAGALIAFS